MADPLPVALVARVDVGGTKILARVVDPRPPIHAVAAARGGTPRGPERIVAAIADLVAHVAGLAGVDRVAAIGVGAAGLVSRTGVVRTAPNLPGVRELDLRGALRLATGAPVVVENDATCAMVAEHR